MQDVVEVESSDAATLSWPVSIWSGPSTAFEGSALGSVSCLRPLNLLLSKRTTFLRTWKIIS
jgi:hypothetical protein